MVKNNKICCEECGVETEYILVDAENEKPLEFCSWEHLMFYAIKKYNKEHNEVE